MHTSLVSSLYSISTKLKLFKEKKSWTQKNNKIIEGFMVREYEELFLGPDEVTDKTQVVFKDARHTGTV
jgi:hypothetical protein